MKAPPALPRPARPDEGAEITALVRAAFARYVPRIGAEPAPMGLDWAACITAGEVFAIDGADGALAAVARLVPEADALLVDTVAVREGLRGTGLGRALIDLAEAQARARGLPRLRLYTNVLMHENRALYARLGFMATTEGGEAPYRRVYMERAVGV